MPGAIGIEQISNKGFEIIPLIETDSTGSWNELETTDFIETTATLNPTIGEVEKSIPIATEKLNESSLPEIPIVSAIQNYPVLEKESLLSILQ